MDESLQQGQYIEMHSVTEDQQTELGQYLFTNDIDYLASADAYRHWPIGRSTFINNDRTMLIWVNNDDHLKFTSTQADGDFGKILSRTKFNQLTSQNIFSNLGQCYQRLIDYVGQLKLSYLWHDRLGWLTQCPTNLGTCFDCTITIRLLKLKNDEEKLSEILSRYNIQMVSVQEDNYSLSTMQKMAITEVETAKSLYDCTVEIINYEKEEIVTE